MWPAGIRKVATMPSRPARYCLGLQDDSVFADFDVDDEGRAFLVRISFDGFGCCHTAEKARPMDLDISESFISMIENDDVRTRRFTSIVEKYLSENVDVIWKDALEEHGLIRN